VASPLVYNTGLYEFNPAFRPDPEGNAAAMSVAVAEALLSGVTTLVDIGVAQQPVADRMIESGIRAVLAPGFRSARWRMPNAHTVAYDWDDALGDAMYKGALAFIEHNSTHPSGRVSGMLAPMQIDTVRPEMIQASHAYAKEHDLPWQIHAGQSLIEFQEMTRRYGLTPIQWLAELGVLDRHTIIGHGIFLDHVPWMNWPTRTDLELIADSGASVAHCPTNFGRRGVTLDHFGRYRQMGINVALGTDSYPHNMIEELRHACYFGRVAARNVHAFTTASVFDAGTIGGATALGRTDIGRLAKGAKADIVLADLTHINMRPARDPLKSLIFSAADRAVTDVFVDGAQLVADGKVTTIDVESALAELDAAQQRSMANTPKVDRLGRTALELVPLALPTLESAQTGANQ
jgi:cytosine/adenosine deaminase-related metal-dependent hydrolase